MRMKKRNEVKIFRIQGRYRRQKRIFLVSKEVAALNEEEALDKFFSEIGRHGIKRIQVEILKIEEISPEEIKNAKLKKLFLSENPVILVKD